jgi:hypothetical protein
MQRFRRTVGVERLGQTRKAGQVGEQDRRPTALLDRPRDHRRHLVVEWRSTAAAEPRLRCVDLAAATAGLRQGSATHAAETLTARVQMAAALTSRAVRHVGSLRRTGVGGGDRPSSTKKTRKCEAFGERLKGFEPSTFCMGKQNVCFLFGADIPCKRDGFRVSMSCSDSPAFTASSRGFGHRMGTRAAYV